MPIHVAPADVDALIRAVNLAKTFDGIIVTVPHKFAVYRECATATERAHILGAVNTLRRNPDGSWHGDQLDGEGLVAGSADPAGFTLIVNATPSGMRARDPLPVEAGKLERAMFVANAGAELPERHKPPVRRQHLITSNLPAQPLDHNCSGRCCAQCSPSFRIFCNAPSP